MRIDTRYFGEVDIADEKIIHFEQGILGFEEYKDYTVLYDVEEGEPFFSWLQSITNKELAFPIVNPFRVKEDYCVEVDDSLLEVIGNGADEDIVVFLMATVPSDIKKASVNMKAPLLINTANNLGMQVVLENPEYPIKYMLLQDVENVEK